MKKRVLSLALVISIIASLFVAMPMTASAYNGSYNNGTLYYDISGGEVTITDCVDSVSGSLEIPATLSGYPVTSIGANAFNDYYLTSITIPSSVTSIGYGAFLYCSSLTSITIPDSVTSIGEYAFSECDSLTSITIPDSVTSIGSYAFYYCSSLTSITIPSSVTSIGNNAFYYCSSLTSITIPDSVVSIGSSAFNNTAWYNNQPNGLVYAGKVAYKYKGTMSDNTSITLKDGTLGIGGSAFSSCRSLVSITIPNSVTSIGSYAFYYCSSLTSITIPSSVTSIGYYTFYGCSSLKDVYLQKGANISVGSNNSYYDKATKHYYEYLIYYDTKGGTISNCYQPVDDATLDVVLSSEIPEKDGFGFLGWSLSANADSVDYEAGENIGTISDNITLYAVFDNNLKVNSYEIFANQIKFNVDTLITDSKESYSLYAVGYDEAGMITALSKEALEYGNNQTEISLDNANKVSTYKITALSDRFMPIADAASGEMSVN